MKHTLWESLVLGIVLCFALMDGCKKSPLPSPTAGQNIKTNLSSSSTAPSEKVTSPRINVQLGVPECDSYVKKYKECILQKKELSPENREQMLKGLESTIEAWKVTVATPEGKTGMVAVCKTATEVIKTRMGCKF